MNAISSHIASKFSTQEVADDYDLWFRSKVEASLRLSDDENTPRYCTDEVARHMNLLIKQSEGKHSVR
jgi:hypothetical protein